MANTTISTGIALIILGLWSYFGTGTTSVTALIPAFFGIVLAALGAVARNEARRKMAMHIAVLVGLLGLLGSARGLAKIGAVMSGEPVERPTAVIAQSMMAAVTGVFVILCINSFIAARRKR